MLIKDSCKLEPFGEIKHKTIHGHVKLTLHNCRTGKNEIHEGSNTVTYAVRDILASNYLNGINIQPVSGASDYNKLLPLWSNWYGGVLVYSHAHPTSEGVLDPSNYFPQSEDDNSLTAHAGDVSPDDIADNLKRGSPNTDLRVITDNSVKQGWEWGSRQGNGPIASISLTHRDTGNAGLGSNSNVFAGYTPLISIGNLRSSNISFNSIQTIFAQYDDNHGLYFHIGQDSDWYAGHSSFGTTTLTIKIRRLPFNRVGLFETSQVVNDGERSFAITTSFTMYLQPSYYFDYANKELWIFSNITSSAPTPSGGISYTAHSIKYARIPCPGEYNAETEYAVGDYCTYQGALYKCTSTTTGAWDAEDWTTSGVITEGEFTSDNDTIVGPTGYQTWQNASSYSNTISRWFNANVVSALFDEDGTPTRYFCFPTGTGSVTSGDRSSFGTCAINGSVWLKPDSAVQKFSKVAFASAAQFMQPCMLGGGIVIKNGIVVNGSNSYPCTAQFGTAAFTQAFYSTYAVANPHNIVSLATPVGCGYSSSDMTRYIVANKMVNTTLYNLAEATQKTATQSMIIEYTLTETETEE